MLTSLKKFGFPLMIVLVIGFFLFLNYNTDTDTTVSGQRTASEEETPFTKQNEEDAAPEDERVMVDVKGEVDDPGVYEVDPETRVDEVIKMAGGFTQNAEQTTVNLAQKVQDEMIVNVPNKNVETPEAVSDNHDDSPIRINDASQEEMEELNGIGPSKAEAIIQYREDNGHFKTVDDILDVSGIGDKTLESLEDDIQVP